MVLPSTSLTSANANVIFLSIQDILLGTNIIPSLPSSSRSSFDTIPKEERCRDQTGRLLIDASIRLPMSMAEKREREALKIRSLSVIERPPRQGVPY